MRDKLVSNGEGCFNRYLDYIQIRCLRHQRHTPVTYLSEHYIRNSVYVFVVFIFLLLFYLYYGELINDGEIVHKASVYILFTAFLSFFIVNVFPLVCVVFNIRLKSNNEEVSQI